MVNLGIQDNRMGQEFPKHILQVDLTNSKFSRLIHKDNNNMDLHMGKDILQTPCQEMRD
jgi:uncharacterized protein YdcH (DUF465 family)